MFIKLSVTSFGKKKDNLNSRMVEYIEQKPCDALSF